ncbi:hypothetical protein KCU65_g5660, partial [Aureobasidium melanogenum]
MADSQIHLNEDDRVTCLRYLRYVYSEYNQPTPSTSPSGSASNPVVIQDDDPPGSALNPVVILDDEPLNSPAVPQTPMTGSEHLANAVQDQFHALEIEDPSSDSGSDSISSRPSSNSGSTITSGVLPPDSLDPSSAAEASSIPDLSPESRPSPSSDAFPSTSPISDVSQSPALELEDSSSADSDLNSASSRPSSNSALPVTPGAFSTIPPDSDCPKLPHKTACLEKDHRNPKCQEWIVRFSRDAAIQVNLAEFSTDADVGERITAPDNPIPPSVFTAISSSTQTAFPEVHVGRKSYRSVGSDSRTLSESLPVAKSAKSMKDREENPQHWQGKRRQDSMPSSCNEAPDHPASGHLLESFEDNQPEESTDTEKMKLEAKARLQQEIQTKVPQTMLEDDEEPDVGPTSLHSQDSYESHPSTGPVTPSSPASAEFEKNVFKNLNDSLSLLGRYTEEHLSEMADKPVSSPQTSTSMEIEQPETQQDTESSTNSQEIGQENPFEYFEAPAVLNSSPAPSDRDCGSSFMRVTTTAIDIPMVSQDAPPSPAPLEFMICSTVKCTNPPSSSDAKCNACRDGKRSIEHKPRQSLLGRPSASKRKHKPRKALANKKQKSNSSSESLYPAVTDATLQDHASFGNSQAVSLPGGHPISWQELCYTVMLKAPNHSSNFKQLCNLVRNWLHNTFPSIKFDINDETMMQNLQAVVKNSPNFEIQEQQKKKQKGNPIEVFIREGAVNKVKIVVSCFRAKLTKPEYHNHMSRIRPETSFENLIGMVLHALPAKYICEEEVITWIEQNIPGYQDNHQADTPAYKDGEIWVQRLREELRDSSFFKMRVGEKGEEWRFRKGCAEHFKEWDGKLD